MNKRRIYLVLNVLSLFLAAVFTVQMFLTLRRVEFHSENNWIILLPLFLVGLLCVHAVKAMRFYLVLLEQKINIWRFLKLYIKTTFVNFVIPFKLGELFRVYCFGVETESFSVGVLSVVVDRFFDTCALLFILIPFELFISGGFTPVTLILTGFILILVFVYVMYMPTYLYLNKYILMNTNSKRGIRILNYLETSKEWYGYTRDLIKGRYPLILVFSWAGWFLEFIVLVLLAGLLAQPFDIGRFVSYIRSIFSFSQKSSLSVTYSCLSSIIFFVAAIAVYFGIYIRNRGEKSE